ncbi:uncharacterized protein E0L32_002706 [Thyridium curvatum]|uniref:Frequency clock protein n=1 Tax=Thyridium curvatum TaxID=1093900 RepID=A0A507BE19_9PEZI|nr:uncharacterized protein E0L32_002706 [Thyridium curvatum]TPX18197.1 hypothetical protein E0L32_002706 [Thyridium curvatum]
MADPPKGASPITHPPPTDRGHPLPRRASPEQSVTLRHHRLARDATMKATGAGPGPEQHSSPRRNSSGESHDANDPKRWFDRSNKNPKQTFDPNNMDVDPPFFQKESGESSNDDSRFPLADKPPSYPYAPGMLGHPSIFRRTTTQSSSADDYRSVIDDLTIENKKLKEELKRYKQFGPDLMRRDKLFEIKVHGLPGRKKRELEATLRDFAAGLEGDSSVGASSQKHKSAKHAKRMQSSRGSMSKHASSSSSHSRPVDSAYASASTGPHSSGVSMSRPSMSSRARSSEQKVEHYLEDIPDGLYPQHLSMTDREKKKIVVKKLEQLFTGKISPYRAASRNQSAPSMEGVQPTSSSNIAIPPSLEASREARMQPQAKKSKSRENMSRENVSGSNNSNGDQSESRGNGNGNGSGSGSGSAEKSGGFNNSPPSADLPEQRPTRPRDLDPDRMQVPADNVDYIRHLGLVPPELLNGTKTDPQDVSMDADGWVYLNLLSNLAQLHILNVPPLLIREAVSEKSTKFQLSPDGRKVRWRGGTDGTKFSSDSGGGDCLTCSSTDDEDGSDKNGQRKRRKVGASGDDLTTSGGSGRPGGAASSRFHYKPLFVHQSSSEETSFDEAGSGSEEQVEDSNMGTLSRWNYSGSGSSPRKRRRVDGAIVYYNGAPFCIDLSGDPAAGETSPTTYMTSTGPQESEESFRPTTVRSLSGSSIPYRPLTDRASKPAMEADPDNVPELTTDESDMSDIDSEFPWCDGLHLPHTKPFGPTLEPSGVGRVFPDDHFAVIVSTRRPRFQVKGNGVNPRPTFYRHASDGTADSVTGLMAAMSTSSPQPPALLKNGTLVVEIEYVTGKIRKFDPVPLPPPATFYPPFTSTSDSEGDSDLDSGEEADGDEEVLTSSAEELISRKANPHNSDNTYPEGMDLTSADEEDEIGPEHRGDSVSPDLNNPGLDELRPSLGVRADGSASGTKSGDLLPTGSSVATAGGEESGYSSSAEDS